MGDPRKRRKQYNSPGHPYQKPRIEAELVLVGRYGLRNKRELWKARTLMGKFRAQARSILALQEEEREVQENLLISKLSRLGIVQEGTTSDEILGMEVEAILKRRLQTLVVENGLANKKDLIKILARGELKTKVNIFAHGFSAKAKSVIEDLGGKAELIEKMKAKAE